MPREPCQALLLDLDGVLRSFDPGVTAGVERRHGLRPGAIAETGFARDVVFPAITGRIGHHEWLRRIGDALGAPEAVAEWDADRGEVRTEVLEWVREVRAAAIPVALVANATDRLDTDLQRLGLLGEVDAVVNSAVIGHPKPAPEFFAAASTAVGVPASRCLLLDDEHRHVAGARAAGVAACRFTSPTDLRYVRAALRPDVEAPVSGE